MLAQAERASQRTFDRARVTLEVLQHFPRLLVADARDQLGVALGETFCAAAENLRGTPAALRLELADEGLRVRLRLDTAISDRVAIGVKSRLAPLGGAIEVLTGETRLWLPRA